MLLPKSIKIQIIYILIWFLYYCLLGTSTGITQVPHCDGHNCNHLWLRIVTAKIGHNAAGLKKLLKSGFSWLFLNFCDFFYFLRRSAFILQKPSYCDGHKCDHLWRFCDSLKAVTMKTVIESFKSPSIPGFFVTICDFVYFYTSLPYSTDFLI
jgi:hypothetical protein